MALLNFSFDMFGCFNVIWNVFCIDVFKNVLNYKCIPKMLRNCWWCCVTDWFRYPKQKEYIFVCQICQAMRTHSPRTTEQTKKKENSNKLLFFEEEDEMYIIKIIYSLFLPKSCGISQFHGEKDSATMTMWTSS